MAQQTAVEWLVEQICTSDMANLIFQQEIKKAKSMEKEQIMDAYEHISMMTAEQYYNETYQSNKDKADN
jgi:hypothetical protein